MKITVKAVLTVGCILALLQGCSKDNSAERAAAEAKIRKTEHMIGEIDRTYSNEVAFIKGVYGTDKPGEMNAKLGEAAQTREDNVKKLQERLKQEQAELDKLCGK